MSGASTVYGRPISTTRGSRAPAISSRNRARSAAHGPPVALVGPVEGIGDPALRRLDARAPQRRRELAQGAVPVHGPVRVGGEHPALQGLERRDEGRAELRVVAVRPATLLARPHLVEPHGEEQPVRPVGEPRGVAVQRARPARRTPRLRRRGPARSRPRIPRWSRRARPAPRRTGATAAGPRPGPARPGARRWADAHRPGRSAREACPRRRRPAGARPAGRTPTGWRSRTGACRSPGRRGTRTPRFRPATSAILSRQWLAQRPQVSAVIGTSPARAASKPRKAVGAAAPASLAVAAAVSSRSASAAPRAPVR